MMITGKRFAENRSRSRTYTHNAYWQQQNRSETHDDRILETKTEELSEEQLSQVVGGLQPQPLPPDHDPIRHRMQ
jgi:bacteriocin-like protein